MTEILRLTDVRPLPPDRRYLDAEDRAWLQEQV